MSLSEGESLEVLGGVPVPFTDTQLTNMNRAIHA